MPLAGPPPSSRDRDDVIRLIGRVPQGDFRIIVRSGDGEPVVLLNAPLLDDGTPMPTLYWLVGAAEVYAVSQLEANGGVNEVEELVGLDVIAEIHNEYAARRDSYIPLEHTGHRPTGGVGGTRTGVKCLHAHFANWLAGNNDAIGQWVADLLDERGIQRAKQL